MDRPERHPSVRGVDGGDRSGHRVIAGHHHDPVSGLLRFRGLFAGVRPGRGKRETDRSHPSSGCRGIGRPYRARETNWVLARENDDFDDAVDKLVSALETDLDYVQLHASARECGRVGGGRRRSEPPPSGRDLTEAEGWLSETGGEGTLADPSAGSLHHCVQEVIDDPLTCGRHRSDDRVPRDRDTRSARMGTDVAIDQSPPPQVNGPLLPFRKSSSESSCSFVVHPVSYVG